MTAARSAVSACCALAALFGVVADVRTQSGSNSTLSGLVTNRFFVPVAGATVWLFNGSPGTEVTALTNRNGVYAVILLPPHQYRMVVESSGFAKAELTGIDLSGDTPRLDFVLAEAGLAIGTVSGARPQLLESRLRALTSAEARDCGRHRPQDSPQAAVDWIRCVDEARQTGASFIASVWQLNVDMLPAGFAGETLVEKTVLLKLGR